MHSPETGVAFAFVLRQGSIEKWTNMAADWTNHLLHSLAEQAGTWFVGVVLALLGIFSGKLVETIKFALNRADLRTKYYEQLARDLSRFVFAVNRLYYVYYGTEWDEDEGQGAIAEMYNESMNELCSQEYVYMSWLHRFWTKSMLEAFAATMQRVREVDAVVIRLEQAEKKEISAEIKSAKAELGTAFEGLRRAANDFLVHAFGREPLELTSKPRSDAGLRSAAPTPD
jgi:hypothetical protein